jgi:hypothetical protein
VKEVVEIGERKMVEVRIGGDWFVAELVEDRPLTVIVRLNNGDLVKRKKSRDVRFKTKD